jgi:hypothetical protein
LKRVSKVPDTYTGETRRKQMTLAPSPQGMDETQVDAVDEAEDHRNIDEDTTLVNDGYDEHLPIQLMADMAKWFKGEV